MGIVYSFYGTKYSRMDQLKFVEASPGFPQVLESPGKSWKILGFEKCCGKFWKVIGFVNFYEKSWKSPGILHNICSLNFLFQVVYKEF